MPPFSPISHINHQNFPLGLPTDQPFQILPKITQTQLQLPSNSPNLLVAPSTNHQSSFPIPSDNSSHKALGQNQSDIALTNVFDRLLSLKRKSDNEDPPEHPSKRPNTLILKHSEPQGSTPLSSGSSTNRKKGTRGRPPKNAKTCCTMEEVADSTLFEVTISQKSSETGEDCLVVAESANRALVAGPKQPQPEW